MDVVQSLLVVFCEAVISFLLLIILTRALDDLASASRF